MKWSGLHRHRVPTRATWGYDEKIIGASAS